MDKITPEGLEEIKRVGEEEKMPYVLVTGSRGVQRARETGQAYMQGIDEENMAEIINREGAEGSKLKEFGVYAMSELDPWAGAAKLLTPILNVKTII